MSIPLIIIAFLVVVTIIGSAYEQQVNKDVDDTVLKTGESASETTSLLDPVTTSKVWQTTYELLGANIGSSAILWVFFTLLCIWVLKSLFTAVKNFSLEKKKKKSVVTLGAVEGLMILVFIIGLIVTIVFAFIGGDDEHEKLMLPVTADLTRVKDGESVIVSMNITQILELIRPTQKMGRDNQVLWECIEVIKPSKEDLNGVLAGFQSVSGEGQNFPRLKLTRSSFDIFLDRGTPWIDVEIRRVEGSIYSSPCSD